MASAAGLSAPVLREDERKSPPPLHLTRQVQIKVIADGDEGTRVSRARSGSDDDHDGGRLSPPPNYSYKMEGAVPTPTTACASVMSLDDS